MRSIRNWGEDPGSRWRRPTRLAAVVLTAMLMALWAPLAGPAGAAPEVADGPTAAAWGAEWLADRMDAGIPFETFGSPDWGTTLEAGLALAAVDGHSPSLDALWDAVVTQREAVVVAGGEDVPGRLAQVILLALAVGEDPTAVGASPGDDLVARLEATRTTAGPDEGLFGTQDATYDGAYRQGYSLAALVAAGVTPDPAAVQWLLDQQCADGSWMPYRADLAQPCAFDGTAFVGPDSNSTGAAISGLVAAGAGADPAVAAALGWLDSVQEADGGFPFFPGDGSDPNSTAVVVQALLAAGSLGDPEFADRDGTPLESLLSFQLGCVHGADAGAFTVPNTGVQPNAFATAQAVSAVGGAPLGITAPVVHVTVPDLCASAPTSTTTSTTSTTTTTTSVVAVTSPPGGSGADPDDGGPGTGVADLSDEADGSDRAAAGSLARTGASSSQVATLGAVLVLLGSAALLVGARRRRA